MIWEDVSATDIYPLEEKKKKDGRIWKKRAHHVLISKFLVNVTQQFNFWLKATYAHSEKIETMKGMYSNFLFLLCISFSRFNFFLF